MRFTYHAQNLGVFYLITNFNVTRYIHVAISSNAGVHMHTRYTHAHTLAQDLYTGNEYRNMIKCLQNSHPQTRIDVKCTCKCTYTRISFTRWCKYLIWVMNSTIYQAPTGRRVLGQDIFYHFKLFFLQNFKWLPSLP